MAAGYGAPAANWSKIEKSVKLFSGFWFAPLERLPQK